jgi:hypothetical protein
MSQINPETPDAAGERLALEISQWVAERVPAANPANLIPERDEFQGTPQGKIPCPRAHMIGDDPSNPHRNRGTARTYDGDLTARLWFHDGNLRMRCFRCCNEQTGDISPRDYTGEIVAELGLEAGNVQGIGERWTSERIHRYPVTNPDGTLIKDIRVKGTGARREKRPFWRFED